MWRGDHPNHRNSPVSAHETSKTIIMVVLQCTLKWNTISIVRHLQVKSKLTGCTTRYTPRPNDILLCGIY